MKTLLILYLTYLSWGTEGQGRVSILEMARYMRWSKTACRNRLLAMANDDLLEVIETFTDRGSKKLFVALSEKGQNYLMKNFDAAIDEHHLHVAETIQAIKERYKEQTYAPRKLSSRELKAIAAGQKDMFTSG